MKVEIITIGDELLIGQTVDTNSAWLGSELIENGFSVHRITSISDNEDEIISALDESAKRVKIIFITGGLGPTRDDITKTTLCKYFNSSLVLNNETLERNKAFFNLLNLPMLATNRAQAEVVECCTIIDNFNGTAPGMWFEKECVIYISMPGVPYEMKAMMSDFVIPLLVEKLHPQKIIHQTIITVGIGESFLAEKLKVWEEKVRSAGIKLAYLPSPGTVKLRISGTGAQQAEIISFQKELKVIIGKYLFAEEDLPIEVIIQKTFVNNGLTLSVAESCTGGYICQLLTSYSGSSDFFKGGVIAYSNQVKINQLDVDENALIQYGAVSKEVVEQMASGVRKKMKTNYGIATSGIAGPTGGTLEKPVGTVWVAIAGVNDVFSKKYNLGNNRLNNIERAARAALSMLAQKIGQK